MRYEFCAVVSILGLALAVPALADPPDRGHGGGPDKGWSGGARGPGPDAGRGGNEVNIYIGDRDRSTVYSYYRTEYAAGRCPPGLAKKHNGCMPPGREKKMWAIGRPLPAEVVFYPLPGPLLTRLSPAPRGYQYVRVANDILMMAIGTRLIAGAVADLSSF